MHNHTAHDAHDKTSRERFDITLEPLATDTRPAPCRLKQLLKLALRGFSLKCISIRRENGAEVLND